MSMKDAHRSPAERPARGGKERSVAIPEIGAADPPPENPHLMAEHGVLKLELGHACASGKCSDQPDEHVVDEGSQGGDNATCRQRSGGAEF